MIKMIRYYTDRKARDQEGINTRMKPFTLMHIKYIMIMGKIIKAASASANCSFFKFVEKWPEKKTKSRGGGLSKREVGPKRLERMIPTKKSPRNLRGTPKRLLKQTQFLTLFFPNLWQLNKWKSAAISLRPGLNSRIESIELNETTKERT